MTLSLYAPDKAAGLERGYGGSEILNRVKEITNEVVAVHAEQVDRDAIWPEQGLRTLLQGGLGGLVIPKKYGGMGQGLLMLGRVCELLGKECASTGICYGMHCVAASVISVNATKFHRDAFLAPICDGKHLTSLSLSEAGTGVYFYLPQTALHAVDPDHYAITGEKVFVTNGGYADSYVVSVVAGAREAPLGQFSCVVVPKRTPGISWGNVWNGIGMRGNSSRSMSLRDVRVPRANLLGREGDQIWYIFNVVTPYFLVAIAATYLGIAASALEEARMHVMHRSHAHTGELARAPLVQHRFGVLWGMLERARRLIYGAAASFDAGEPDALVAIMASKAEIGDCAVAIVNEAMTLTGGRGYSNGSKLSRHLRDVRAVHLMSPSTDMLRTWIGRSVLGVPLLAD